MLVSSITQVIFDGEEAVDAGGVTKEFFLLLLKELMDPIYGMFSFHNDSNLLWFSDKVSCVVFWLITHVKKNSVANQWEILGRRPWKFVHSSKPHC